MARHQSAIRQRRRSLRRNAINKRNKTSLRTQVKDLRRKIQAGDKAGAETMLPGVISASDKAAKKRSIHKNRAARLKSRMSRQVRSVKPSPSA